MKALSLWEPWASLIAVGAKKYETRSWATSYRGPLLICAAAGGLPKKELFDILAQPIFQGILNPKGLSLSSLYSRLPFGAALCVVDMVACTRTENLIEDYRADIPFGDFSYGRYAWKLENVRAIEPFPVKGKQGLFEVEDSIIKEALAKETK